jgi:hypothetical protein
VRSDVATLHIDLLSARCTVDRLRQSVGPTLVAAHVDMQKVNEINCNLAVITSFMSSIQELMAQSKAYEKGDA